MKNTGAIDAKKAERLLSGAALEDELRFFDACERLRGVERANGIGTLGEKTLHAALKLYIEPDAAKHEINIAGKIADVMNENGIFEIQTRSLNRLRDKLNSFLTATECNITIVHPISATKHIIWLDPTTGEMTEPRISPKKGCWFHAFSEIYKLSALVLDPRIRIMLLLIDMDEYRLLNGWSDDKKRGATRFERMPTALVDSILLSSKADYAALLPFQIGESFTSAELAKTAGINLHTAQYTLNVLARVGAIECIGRKNRSKLYNFCSDISDQPS